MSQQINLFNPIFLKQKKYFSAVAMVQALALVLIGSLLVSGYTFYQVARLGKEAVATKGRLASTQAQLDSIKAQYAPAAKNAALQEQIRKMEVEVQSLQQLSDILQKSEFGNTKGYSDYLAAFSRQIGDGIWLTGLSLQGSGNEIALQGRALRPELVPGYITRLGREPVMQGKSFASLEMRVPQVEVPAVKDQPRPVRQIVPAAYIEFSLQSRGQTDTMGTKSQ
jgi:Tfp pilus assembly protein PilN